MSGGERVIHFGPPVTVIPEGSGTRALRRVVLPILVVERDGTIHPIGTCFVVSPTEREALVFTAKHNIDYIMRIDGSREMHAPTTPPEFRVVRFRQRAWTNLRVFVGYWLPDDTMIPCDLVRAWFIDTGQDIAAALLRIPERYQATFTQRLRINSFGPVPGESVRAAGYRMLAVDSPVRDEDGVIIAQSLSIPLHIEEAAVTRRNGNGEHHLIRWPCVELGCALDHGMSGGPIFVLQPDGVVVACGVVTSGSSFAPEGVASLIYPALSIRLDTDSILGVGNTPSLLDCVRSGLVRDMAEAHKHVRSDGSWSTQPLSAIELQDLAGLPVGGAVVANTSETCAVEYLSDECLHLGRVNQHNGDDADYFLISEEVCQLLRESPIQGDTLAAKLRFLKAEQPHVWFLVGEQPFRLVVFAVEGDRHPPVKILTDARRDATQLSPR
jgi:hypothetical protein